MIEKTDVLSERTGKISEVPENRIERETDELPARIGEEREADGLPDRIGESWTDENRIMDGTAENENREMANCPREGHGGHWEGERGNSMWYPDRDEIPRNPITNPEGKTWGEILDKYGIDGIPFVNGEPDFSAISKGTVEIDNFTDQRNGKGGNFDQAYEKLAEQRGCTKEEVKAWMAENKYTWHERSDCKTMDKVPTEIHGNISHSGGISEMKKTSDQTN